MFVKGWGYVLCAAIAMAIGDLEKDSLYYLISMVIAFCGIVNVSGALEKIQ